MNDFLCPICGARQPRNEEGFCIECNADLQSFTLTLEEHRDSKTELSDQIEQEENEWIVALKSHYEKNTLLLPQEWLDRLQRMWLGVEVGRRRATIAFIDLREYTRLTNLLPPSQLNTIRQHFYEICLQSVSLHGGFIIKFMGDGVFAAFGAPHAFDRDSESAMKAMLDIRKMIHEKNSEIGLNLSIHAGAAVGLVEMRVVPILGNPQPDLFGSPVNLAWRLLSQAGDDEILISNELADQMGNLFEMEPVESFVPRNYDRAVTPYRVLDSKPSGLSRRPHRYPFIGRNEELSKLKEWLEIKKETEVSTIFVQGNPGVGKSRFVEEFLMQNILNNEIIIRIDCEPHNLHVPYITLQKLTKVLLNRLTLESEKSKGSLQQLIAANPWELEPEVHAAIGYLLGSPDAINRMNTIPGQILTKTIMNGVTSLFRLLVKEGRISLFVDDIQWCDPLSLEYFRTTIRYEPIDLILICVGRPSHEFLGRTLPTEAFTSTTLPVLEETKRTIEIELELLSSSEVNALITHILDWNTLHPFVRKYFTEDLEGNPHLLIECAQLIKKQISKDSQNLLDTLSLNQLPMNLYELLQSRIDDLNLHHRHFLQNASILGRRFQFTFLQAFSKMQERLQENLMALHSLNLLKNELIDSKEYIAFASTVMRDVVYESLPDDQREKLHAKIAMYLEMIIDRNSINEIFELAYHWIRGNELEQGSRYLLKVCESSIRLGSAQNAYFLLEDLIRRIESANISVNKVLQMQLGLCHQLAGKATRFLGDFEKSNAHLHSFKQIAKTVQNYRWKQNARFNQCINKFEQGELIEVESELKALIEEVPNFENKADVLCLLGMIALRTARLDEASDQFQQIITNDNENQTAKGILADAWNNLGLIHWNLANLKLAEDAFKKAIELRRKHQDFFGEIASLSNLGITQEQSGNIQRAKETYYRTLKLAEEIGYLHAISAIEANLSNILIQCQDWHEAQLHASRSLHFAKVIGHKHSEAIAQENLGIILAGLNLGSEAIKALERAEQLGLELKDEERIGSAILEKMKILIMNKGWGSAQAVSQHLPANLSPADEEKKSLLERTIKCFSNNQPMIPASNELFQENHNGLSTCLFKLDIWICLEEFGMAIIDRQELYNIRKKLLKIE